MDIHQFEGFVAAATYGSYTRASEELCVTRQALSKSVKRLEGEVGFKVFTVGENRLELTDQGRGLLNDVAPLVSAFCDLEARYVAHGELASDVRVAMSHGALDPVEGNPVIMMAGDPSIRFLIEETNADDVLSMVRSGESDIGFVCSNPMYLGEFDIVALAHPGFFVRVPPGNDLAGRTYLELEDIKDRKFVTLGRHDHAHRLLVEECLHANAMPRMLAELPDVDLVWRFCDRENALSLVCGANGPCGAANALRVPLLMRGAQQFGSYAIHRKGAAMTRASLHFWRCVKELDVDAGHARRKR